MSMPLASYYSADAVRSLPDDGKRYETVHGELLVTPSPVPTHQRIITRLIAILHRYLDEGGVEGLLTSPADISWGADTLVQPDLLVADDSTAMRSGKWADITTLYLVVEILSPSSVRADRFTKRRLYQEREIPTYWIVDIDNSQVELWTPDALFPTVERERLRWRHPEIALECVVDLVELLKIG